MMYESFIARWNEKANSYVTYEDRLVAAFDEFVTRFIVYKILYKLCAEKLSYGSRMGDKTKAVDAVSTILSNRMNVLHDMEPYIIQIHDSIQNNRFVIDTNNAANDKAILKGMMSSDEVTKLKSVLTCIYKLRCNLIHGDKAYMEEQRQLLEAANNCLRIINEAIHSALLS